MKQKTANAWLFMFRTRPMWGMIPLRVLFALVVIASALWSMKSAEGNQQIVFAIQMFAGLLLIPGFLARPAGLFMAATSATLLFMGALPNVYPAFENVTTQVLMLAISFMLFVSGAGRHSVDHWISCRVLKACSIKKWEAYCLAETPYTKWWE